MSFGFGFGFPKRLTSGGGLSPRLYLDFVGTGSLPSTVTFSRGTNATLTDSNGRVAWAPHNLLLNSESFESSSWTKQTNVTVVANDVVAPDGTTTADRIDWASAAGSTGVLQPGIPINGAANIKSVYVRADVAGGTIEIADPNTTVGITTATLTTAWQRVVLYEPAGSQPTNGGLWVRRTASSPNSIYVWGAQLNVANAPVNLLTWSQALATSPWAGQSGFAPVVTNNAGTAPDGTNTATSIVFSGQYQNQRQSVVATPGVNYTFSFWARVITGNTSLSFFHENSATGVSTNVSITTSWARYSVTVLGPSSGGSINFGIQDRNASGFGEIYVWGAQVNTGSVALPYVATTSSIYLPPAYNSTTPKNLLGFTQEPENAAWTKSNSYVQQNQLTSSQNFSGTGWVVDGIVLTADAGIAPDGTNTATSAVLGTGNNRVYQFDNTGITGNKVFSIYVKSNAGNTINITAAGGMSPGATAVINTSTGVITGFTGASSVAAGNGWYRVSLPVNVSTPSGNSTYWYINGPASSAFIWGAQLVQGSTAGDYTQTTSAAAPTRYLNWDGTLTGRKLVEDAAASVAHRVFQTQTTPAGPVTFSAYIKAGERTWAYLRINDATLATLYAWFNLATGTVGTVQSGLTASISSVGGGWYRCAVVVTASVAANQCLVALAPSDNVINYTGDGTSGIYVSDFQLSNSASVDPYVYNPQAAAASAAYYGPRFDYNPTTLAANGLLIEEQRTNLLTYSQEIGGTNWTSFNGTSTINNLVAPDGTTTATLFTENTSNSQHAVYGTNMTLTAAVHTCSAYIKGGTRRYVSMRTENTASGYAWVTLDTQTGAVNSNAAVTSSSATSVGNGWYRVTVTFANTTVGAGNIVLSGSDIATAPGTAIVFGNTYTGTSGTFYVWGAQLEQGAFSTSYIPTVASQVTRSADSASMLGDNFYTWYNVNQGSIQVDVRQPFPASMNSNVLFAFGVLPSGSGNAWWLAQNANQFNLRSGGVFGSTNSAVGTLVTENKTIVAYNSTNGIFASINGAAVVTGTNFISQAANALWIGAVSNTQNFANGTIRRIGYYNTRLPDSTLQALTT